VRDWPLGNSIPTNQPTNQPYLFLYAFALLQPVPKASAAETDPIRKSGKRVVQLGVIAPDTVDEVWSGLVGLCLQLPLQRCSATEAVAQTECVAADSSS
jgi:hypothetical protein